MKFLRAYPILFFGLLILTLGFPPRIQASTKDKKIAYIYTDNPTGDDETTEFLDASGQRIKEYEYRALYEEESKDLQKRASAAFGQAGKGFGQEQLKSMKVETVNKEKFKSASAEKKSEAPPDAPAEKISESLPYSLEPEPETGEEAVLKKSKDSSSKPKVLVS